MSLIAKMKSNKIIKDSIAEESEDVKFISTGCSTLNLLFSGKLDGGIAIGKISQISADSAMGKSFIGLKVAANAQKMGLDVLLLDTEFCFNYEFSDNVGVDRETLLVVQDNSIESAQQKILTLLEDIPKEDRSKLLIILDSWSGLTTSKTVDDATSGADKTDLTVSKKRNSFARILTGLGCTVFVISQVYSCGTNFMKVKTPNGDVSLSDLKVGDIVLTTNGFEEISYSVKYEDAFITTIELENGEILEFTNNHKFKVRRDNEIQWVTVDDLIEGEDLLEYM